MRFLHVADTHLDSSFSGVSYLTVTELAELQQSIRQAFTKMVDYALKSEVEMVLLVGDVFDTPNPTPSTQIFLREQIKRLTDHEIYCVMSFGNHDYGSYERLLLVESSYLRIFHEEVAVESFTLKNGEMVDVIGFSYPQNHLTADKLAEFPAKNPQHLTIATLHGSQEVTTAADNVYAPFSLELMRQKNYDYYALGHIHKRQDLLAVPPVVYPGNIQGRNINETGPKGFYDVTVTSDQTVQKKFVPVSQFDFTDFTLQLEQELSKNELMELISDSVSTATRPSLFNLKIIGAELLSQPQLELLQAPDFMMQINQQLPDMLKVIRLTVLNANKVSLNEVDQQYFEEAADATFTEAEIRDLTKKLTLGYPFIETALVQPEFLKEVQNLSETLMQQELNQVPEQERAHED